MSRYSRDELLDFAEDFAWEAGTAQESAGANGSAGVHPADPHLDATHHRVIGRPTSAARDERRCRQALYGWRSGTVDSSPSSPPVGDA